MSFEDLGRVEQHLPADERMTCDVVHAEVDGEERLAFRKANASPNTAIYVANEVAAMPVVTRIGAKAQPSFRTPALYHVASSTNGTTFYAEYIDGTPLSQQADHRYQAQTLAQMAAAFQQYGPVANEPPRWTLRSTHEEHMERFRAELEQQAALGRITQEDIEHGLGFIARMYPALKPAASHADLTEKHVITDPTGQAEFVVIDSEHFRDSWPEHYDIANLLARYAVTHPDAGALEWALDTYAVAMLDADTVRMSRAIAASLMIRSLAIVKALPPTELDDSAQDRRERALNLVAELPSVYGMADLRRLLLARGV